MNIVACAAEPEFIMLEATDGGGIDLTIEIARMQVAGVGNQSGTIQLHFLPADVDIITTRLAEIAMAQQHSTKVPDEDPDDEPCDCGTVRGDQGYITHAAGGHPDCTGNDE